MPQVKTPEAGACAVFRISLGFKQLAHGLHVFWDRTACMFFGMTAVYAALLAAIAVIRIRLPLEVRIVLAWISAA
jgi:hypothetical protein